MQEAFDWVNRDLVFYKLLQNNIDGIYDAVKSLYSNPTACVKLNNVHTDWFETKCEVNQVESLSMTFF